MNRILEAYEGDDEFTRSRLIDEDATMQIELKTMKVCYFTLNQLIARSRKIANRFAILFHCHAQETRVDSYRQ